jgi:hypothetical protein
MGLLGGSKTADDSDGGASATCTPSWQERVLECNIAAPSSIWTARETTGGSIATLFQIVMRP